MENFGVRRLGVTCVLDFFGVTNLGVATLGVLFDTTLTSRIFGVADVDGELEDLIFFGEGEISEEDVSAGLLGDTLTLKLSCVSEA